MDPDANVIRQREIIAELAALPAGASDARGDRRTALLEELQWLREAMSNWIACGGFRPTETL